jgi:hypothetical protein
MKFGQNNVFGKSKSEIVDENDFFDTFKLQKYQKGVQITECLPAIVDYFSGICYLCTKDVVKLTMPTVNIPENKFTKTLFKMNEFRQLQSKENFKDEVYCFENHGLLPFPIYTPGIVFFSGMKESLTEEKIQDFAISGTMTSIHLFSTYMLFLLQLPNETQQFTAEMAMLIKQFSDQFLKPFIVKHKKVLDFYKQENIKDLTNQETFQAIKNAYQDLVFIATFYTMKSIKIAETILFEYYNIPIEFRSFLGVKSNSAAENHVGIKTKVQFYQLHHALLTALRQTFFIDEKNLNQANCLTFYGPIYSFPLFFGNQFLLDLYWPDYNIDLLDLNKLKEILSL